MAQQFLDGTYVRSCLQERRSVRMPKRMGRNVLANSASECRCFNGVRNMEAAQAHIVVRMVRQFFGIDIMSDKQRMKIIDSGILVCPEVFCGDTVKIGRTDLPSLSAYGKFPVIQVEIIPIQTRELRDSESAGKYHPNDRSVP